MKQSKRYKNIANSIDAKMTIWPILFGIIGVAIMLWYDLGDDLNKNSIALYTRWITLPNGAQLAIPGWIFMIIAMLMMVGRDLSGMYRTRIMAGQHISWLALLRIRFLYEFTSSITPSAAGGSTLEMLFIHMEGVKVSKATSMTILSLFLDEIFFVILMPLLCLLLPIHEIFSFDSTFSVTLLSTFAIGFSIKFVWAMLLLIGLFFEPKIIANFVGLVCRIKFLKRYKNRALRTCVEIEQCSNLIRKESLSYWIKLSISTILIWFLRFMVANMLIMAFDPLSLWDNILIFARQYVVGVVMIIAPTPGGSGFQEVLFNSYLGEFISSSLSVVLIAALWRVLTYYYYLIGGVIILPNWIKHHFGKKHEES